MLTVALQILVVAVVPILIGLMMMYIILNEYIKRAGKGKFLVFFQNQRAFGGQLLKEENGHLYLGKGKDREKYNLSEARQLYCLWPGGPIPRSMQTVMRVHLYNKGFPDPVDLTSNSQLMTAKSLRILTDEAMLKSSWEDVRRSLGIGVNNTANSMLIIMMVVMIALEGINLYLTFILQKSLGG